MESESGPSDSGLSRNQSVPVCLDSGMGTKGGYG